MVRYGYARVSTDEQEIRHQVERLIKDGYCEEKNIVVHKHTARVETVLPTLSCLLQRMQPGDTLVALSLSRLGRSARGLLQLLDILVLRKIDLHVLDLGLPIKNSCEDGHSINHIMSRVLYTIFSSFIEMDTEIRRTRAAEGIKYAKLKGKYAKCGRPSVNKEKRHEILKLHKKNPTLSYLAISKITGVSNVTVAKIIKKLGELDNADKSSR